MASLAAANDDLDGLHSSLSKIRHHTTSKLENQKGPAQLLVAIDSSLAEQDQASNTASATGGGAAASKHAIAQRQPAEYFLALESMLERAQSKQTPPTLFHHTLYLLSIITPYVSAGIIRARLSSVIPAIGSILSNPHPSTSADGASAENYSAALRSALTILQSVYQAFSSDVSTLDKDLALRACWNSTLNLCIDSRPKVRRRAQQLVIAILPASSSLIVAKPAHPFVTPTFEWMINTLSQVADAGSVVSSTKDELRPQFDKKTGKAKQASAAAALRQQRVTEGDSASVGIWLCGFVKQTITLIPLSMVDLLCAILLRLPGLQNPFLTVAALDVFEAFLKGCRPTSIPSQPAADALLLVNNPSASPSSIGQKTLAHLIDTLQSPALVPSLSDVQLLPPYLRALQHALVAYSRFEDGNPAWALIPLVWSNVFSLALSAKSDASRTSSLVRGAGRDTLIALLRYCVPDSAIAVATKARLSKAPNTPFLDMVQMLDDALGRQALQFMHSRAEILSILTAVISRLRYQHVESDDALESGGPTAGPLALHLVKNVADLRNQPNFEHREYADAVIATAVEVCGPRILLDALPLNLLGQQTGPGRAWLLPLIRNKITNTDLSHFTEELVPLSEQLFNKRGEAANNSKPIEAKMWEALTEQVWACFPAYCDMPRDLVQAFTRHFAELLTNVLYTQATLRSSVCRGLQALVVRNEALVASGAPGDSLKKAFGLDQADGKLNIAHLANLAPNLLAVLFNVFSQSPGEARGFVYETICAYLRVMGPSDIVDTYQKVKSTLEQSLPALPQKKGNHSKDSGAGSVPPVPYTMLDLLVALIPHLDKSVKGKASDLFTFICKDHFLRSHDSSVQKKSYRILGRLIEGESGKQVLLLSSGSHRLGELLEKLRESTPYVSAVAKRDRVLLLATLIPHIPNDELHVLPSIIPEAVLATKEANQVTRSNAYELLVQMGRKMEAGGSINRGLVEGFNDADADADANVDADTNADAEMVDTQVVSASITEYLTMVAAGLAGTTPHMISATITSLSRLVFEFKQDLTNETLDEMLATIVVFLQSANREIVKSAIGFAKVAIVDFSAQLIDKHLATLIPALLGWSSEHKQHFKSKVRHIFERLLRRFGFERINELTDEDNRKLIVNIRKRKERAKRQKNRVLAEGQTGAGDDSDDEMTAQPVKRSTANDAFEEVIYGSESDISDSDDDNDNDQEDETAGGKRFKKGMGNNNKKGGKKNKDNEVPSRRRNRGDEAYIMEDDDEPMDLLDRSAAARITLHDPNVRNKAERRRKPGQEASKFKLDEKTGRMLITDDKDNDEVAGRKGNKMNEKEGHDVVDVDVEGAGRAYMDLERGIDGFTSGARGVVKFNKNNKRGREQERELELEQMAVEEAASSSGQVGGNKQRPPPPAAAARKQKQKIGSEFRSKRGGGDIMKDGKSPYAYVPLSQVAGKKSKKNANEISFTNKDKSWKRK